MARSENWEHRCGRAGHRTPHKQDVLRDEFLRITEQGNWRKNVSDGNGRRSSHREDYNDCRMGSEPLDDRRVDEREVGAGEVFGVSWGEKSRASRQCGGRNR